MSQRLDADISVREAAHRLGIGLQYIYQLLWSGKLPAHKIGKRWWISEAAIAARIQPKQSCNQRS